MTIKYPIDKRESVLIEFALRFLDDDLETDVEKELDNKLNDKELISLYAGELEDLADAFKEGESD